MHSTTRTTDAPLENREGPVKLELSALWATVMLCYLYADYLGLYQPGTLKSMFDGQSPVQPVPSLRDLNRPTWLA